MTEGIPLGRDKTLAQNVFKGLMCRDLCEVVIHDTQRDLKWLICRLILYLRRRRGCAEFQKTADLANIYLGYFFPPGVAKFWALQLVELKQMSNCYRLFQKNKGF